MTRAQAIAEARRFAEDTIHRVVDGVVGIVDKAIEVRRLEPMRFALYHYKMKLWRLAQGKKVARAGIANGSNATARRRGRWTRRWPRSASPAWTRCSRCPSPPSISTTGSRPFSRAICLR
ncbi:MAG: hypothetical protein IPH07_23685 [Deltaproteobacteria bacterium]|nr:hypothetical protein [Deltaproteobacteria bacterium]